MPVRLTRPWVVENPTMFSSVAGITIDPPVSLPRPTAANHAAMAAPVPELEPPGYLLRLYGLSTWPFSVLAPGRATPYQSARLVFPRMTAPARRRRSMTKESRDGCDV